MQSIKAIIVDDEELGRSIIQEYLADHPQVEIVAQCRDAHEALDAINKHHPDLLFLDIQMPEISGFELLEMLDDPPKIIFSTAYDQYAIKAFEVNAIDYLLKPYDVERFSLALERAIRSIQSDQGQEATIKKLLQSIQPAAQHLERLLIKQAGRIVIISCKEIHLIKAMDDYAEIVTAKESYLIQQSLNHLEQRLNPDQFVRTHRSYIVNIDSIRDIVALSNSRYKLFLKDGKEINISRSGYKKLQRFTL
ncbi:MAG: LytTR family transcriptional regulator DNA-binding domain-containing protein [bacterium]|nr:LytTR family transcriptional regulator DNA-binding domain-containing protein [bacterium]